MEQQHGKESWVPQADWRRIDAEIGRLAKQKGALDLEEGRWLLAAERAKVHLQLGFASIGEYVERRLGYDRRACSDRLRVARALTELPLLRDALGSGALPWTAVRELVRVAVADNEAAWIRAAEAKTVREVETLVSGHHLGDDPEDPTDPSLKRVTLRLSLSPELAARYHLAVDRVFEECGGELTEEDALRVMIDGVLDGRGDTSKPPLQVHLTVCKQCERTWQRTRGGRVAVDREVGERALCDSVVVSSDVAALDPPTHVGATHVGALATVPSAPVPPLTEDAPEPPASEGQWRAHAQTAERRGRAFQTVTPSVRREVFERDGGRCIVPGCRNTRWLHVHHLWPQSAGGSHDPSNLGVLCDVHHQLCHAGRIRIEGSPGDWRVYHADGQRYGAPAAGSVAGEVPDAIAGLRALGFDTARSRSLVAEVQRSRPDATSAPELLREAVRIGWGERTTATTAATAPAARDEIRDAVEGLRVLGFDPGLAQRLIREVSAPRARSPAPELIALALQRNRSSHPATTGIVRDRTIEVVGYAARYAVLEGGTASQSRDANRALGALRWQGRDAA